MTLWISCLLLATPLLAQQKGIVVPLWPEGAPTSNETTGDEQIDPVHGYVRNISEPTLTIYPAKEPNGQCVISSPGGAYIFVSMKYEGYDMADWFTSRGITFAILKYRLPNGHAEVPLDDAKQAIKIMRSRAEEYGITQVGMMGASAGGHLTASASTLLPPEERPDFQILVYPLISLIDRPYQERYLEIMGGTPSEERLRYFSLETQVDEQTPPAFITHSANDPIVPVDDSILYFRALHAKGIPASLHIYPSGGHGWGMKDSFTYKTQWTQELEKWLWKVSGE